MQWMPGSHHDRLITGRVVDMSRLFRRGLAVAALLASAALVATFLPARRVTQIDPVVALAVE